METKSGFRFPAGFTLLCLVLAPLSDFDTASSAQEHAVQILPPLVLDLDSLDWGPPGGGNGVPVGVQTKRVTVDEASGGFSYYAKFPAGSHFDRHWHTHNEFVVVVNGELEIVLGDTAHQLSVGSYIVIPGAMRHSWDVPSGGEDAVIFVRRAGPADFHFVDRENTTDE